MSDRPQGEGWWQASDGRWYPPELHPARQPAPAPAAVSRTEGPLIAALAAIVVLIVGLGAFALVRNHGGSKSSSISSSALPTPEPEVSSDTTASSSSSSAATSTSSGSTASNVPAGYMVVHDDKDGASFAIPATYHNFDLENGDAQAALDQFASANPSLASAISQAQQLLQKGGRIFAIDDSAAGHFADNVNMVVTQGTVDLTEPAAATEIEQELQGANATNVTSEVVDTSVGKGLAVSYTLMLTNASGAPVTVQGRQLYVVHNGTLFIITFSAGPDTDIDGTFAVIRNTFAVE